MTAHPVSVADALRMGAGEFPCHALMVVGDTVARLYCPGPATCFVEGFKLCERCLESLGRLWPDWQPNVIRVQLCVWVAPRTIAEAFSPPDPRMPRLLAVNP